MSDIVERARKVVELRGDTYSSYEVIGLLGQLADEIERLRLQCSQWEITVNQKDDEIERLLAINVELVVSLKDALTCLEVDQKIRQPSWDRTATPNSTIGMARAAIAKSEGKRPTFPSAAEWLAAGTKAEGKS